MNYIGSKNRLSDFIFRAVVSVAGTDLSGKIFCDLFAGTGAVSRKMKGSVKQIIANDCEAYSFVLNKNYIGNTRALENAEEFIADLNAAPPTEGFIFKNYCLGGGNGRAYFSDENGKKIDAARQRLRDLNTRGRISSEMYFFLLCSLLESADKVANTASVYGAFLKKLKKSARKPIVVEPAFFELCGNEHLVFREDANALVEKIEGDILYLDPPYNARQYGANYHLLNTIAEYEEFSPRGKTGLPPRYARSKYCSAKCVEKEFDAVLARAKFKHIFLSYNNEGLMRPETIRAIMEKYGKYDLATTQYRRFAADKPENRVRKADATTEYLHILAK